MKHYAQPSAENDAKVSLTCSARSFDCIAPLYNGFTNVYDQSIITWVDPYESSGGQWVRAACSNVAPSLWNHATRDNAKRVGRNRDIAQSTRLERAGKTEPESRAGVSTSRSVRRLLRRGRKKSR